MECVKWCQECNDFTKHNGKNRCNVCKSRKYQERLDKLKDHHPDTMCAQMIKLEKVVYDLKKEITNHG